LILVMWQLMGLLLIVSGCHHQTTKATVTTARVNQHGLKNPYLVAKSDTLYSIAFAYQLDYHVLAKMNCIKPPYPIHVGQALSLTQRRQCGGSKAFPSTKVSQTNVKPKTNNISFAEDDTFSALNQKDFFTPIVHQPVVQQRSWKWPVQGPILARFSAQRFGQNGIDIGGKLNTPIKACADGTVVYSGQGLKSYGKLLIIKHNDADLSAYAHNNQLLVKEGQAVKMRQMIATMGYTGTDRVKLHFEIRHQGKAVNPLLYLTN
jgi:lipoprotein NlpD